MAKIKTECPKCGRKNVHETKQKKIGSRRIITLSCGHFYIREADVKEKEVEEIVLEDGKTLYPYQVEGYKFAARSNFNCLIGDEMGLGKTIQAVAIMKLHWDELKPFLIVCKGSLTLQWQRHIFEGCEKMAQILERGTKPIKGANCYIVSFDMTHKLEKTIKSLQIKTVIADEIQMIKNHDAKRTQGLREICR